MYLEEYARGMIGEEEQHSLELKVMLKDSEPIKVIKVENLCCSDPSVLVTRTMLACPLLLASI